MKRYLLAGILIPLLSCSRGVIYITPPKKPIPIVIQEALYSLTAVPFFSSEMKSGDLFLLTISPGIAFSETENISFAYTLGDSLISDLKIINQAYNFAKLVNKVLVPDYLYNETGMLLGDYYSQVIQQLTRESSFNDMDYIPQFKLTNPTCDDDFFYTTINPLSKSIDSSWIKMDKTIYHTYNLNKPNRKSIEISLPSYKFSGNFIRLNLARPWFKWPYLSDFKNIQGKMSSKDVAMITGLILANDLKVYEYKNSSSQKAIYQNWKKLEDPTLLMETKSTTVIGFICVLL